MSKKHMGSSLDDFLKEEGIFEETQAQAVPVPRRGAGTGLLRRRCLVVRPDRWR